MPLNAVAAVGVCFLILVSVKAIYRALLLRPRRETSAHNEACSQERAFLLRRRRVPLARVLRGLCKMYDLGRVVKRLLRAVS